ncbi:MAG TPA: PaaI family thioesterase [Gemmatimonadaceae bacterium]|nr:PaaI family thioesterase [Gemmatimonadaceae bacterium]
MSEAPAAGSGEAADEAMARRVHASFERQRFMATLGARLTAVEPGRVSIALAFRDDLIQQHGFLHAGVVTTIADSACGYAALTRMPPDFAVLSTEFKINLLAPARGESFEAVGTVLKAGRTLLVCRGEVFSVDGGQRKRIAEMLGTMMAIQRAGLSD